MIQAGDQGMAEDRRWEYQDEPGERVDGILEQEPAPIPSGHGLYKDDESPYEEGEGGSGQGLASLSSYKPIGDQMIRDMAAMLRAAAERPEPEPEAEQEAEAKEPKQWGINQEMHFFCSDSKGNRIGSCIVLPIQQDGICWLSDVWVQDEHRGQGMARQLIERAIQYWGHVPIILRVHPYADQALSYNELVAFYGKFGFHKTDLPGMLLREGTGPEIVPVEGL